MIDLEKLPHPTILPYPNHYTAAFFHTAEEACAAIEDLESRWGYHDEDFNVFDGETGVEAVDLDGIRHTVLERFMRRFLKFSDSSEWRFLKEADQELKTGNILVCVATLQASRKEEVARTFREYGGYDLRYFTPVYIEELE